MTRAFNGWYSMLNVHEISDANMFSLVDKGEIRKEKNKFEAS